MSEKKNIDRLFQEKFKNFEQTPQDSVWDKVNTTLHGNASFEKPVPVWWKWAGIAAAIVILLSAGSYFMYTSSPSTENNKVVDVDNSQPKITTDPTVRDSELDANSVTTTDNTNSSEPLNNTEKRTNIIGPSEDKNNSTGGSQLVTTAEKNEDQLRPNDVQKEIDANAIVQNKTTPSKSAQTETEDRPFNVRQSQDVISSKNANADGVAANTNKSGTTPSISKTDKEPTFDNNTVSGEKVASAQNSQQDNPTSISTTETTQADVKLATNDSSNNRNKVGSTESQASTTKSELPSDAVVKAEGNVETETPTEIAEELAIVEDTEEEEIEKLNRWNISPNVSPVYFNNFGNGSSIDSQFNENAKSGNINFSYGINGSYALNNKLKLRAGVNKVDLGYTTNQVIVYRNTNAIASDNSRLRYVKYKDDQLNTSFISASNLSYAVIPDVVANNIKGSIDQEIGFIEVPLEVEYALLQKRFGLNLIGGFSTFFLNKNEVYSTLQGNRTLLGEANNLNNTSYSANIGLGFSFRFTDMLDLNLEPTFKYQLETFSESAGDFQPYFIGVYTGLRFKF